jgi:hypothetical protein
MIRMIFVPALLALLGVAINGQVVRADTINAPGTFTTQGSADTTWGIQFTALQNTTLIGFDYFHDHAQFGSSFSGTLEVIDTASPSTPLYSATYPIGSLPTISTTGLNVQLSSGHVYQLLASSSSPTEEWFYSSSTIPYPASDSDISVTTAVYVGSDNTPFMTSHTWAAFTNIQTSDLPSPTSTTPEPSTLALLAVGCGCIMTYCHRRRKLDC